MMKGVLFTFILFIMGLMGIYSCVYPFNVVPDSSWESILSVEGSIIVGGTSEFYFTSTIKANEDESTVHYERVDDIWIEDEDGLKFRVTETYSDPKISVKYIYNGDGLSTDGKYKLCFVWNGKNYESSLQEVLITPPIDSITFTTYEYDKVRLFVNTRASEGQYLKWHYNEVWEDRVIYIGNAVFDEKLGNFVSPPPLDEDPRIFCWKYHSSDEILLSDSLAYKDNLLINKIVDIHYNNRRISKLYNIDLFQRSVSHNEYVYWNNINKNSEDVGGIFSQLPSELKGNLTCIDDPDEFVLGYIGAATIEKYRKFIYAEDLMIYKLNEPLCDEYLRILITDPIQILVYAYQGWVIFNGEIWVRVECTDCRLRGGSKVKPDYWPGIYN